MDRMSRLISEKDFRIYEDIDSYLNDHVGFSDLVLGNFKSIFAIYLSVLTFFSVCFITRLTISGVRHTICRLRSLLDSLSRGSLGRFVKRSDSIKAIRVIQTKFNRIQWKKISSS